MENIDNFEQVKPSEIRSKIPEKSGIYIITVNKNKIINFKDLLCVNLKDLFCELNLKTIRLDKESNNLVIYVGMSENLKERISGHLNGGDATTFGFSMIAAGLNIKDINIREKDEFFTIYYKQVEFAESKLIEEYDPPFNLSGVTKNTKHSEFRTKLKKKRKEILENYQPKKKRNK